MLGNLHNQVAVVTGGSRGIGRGIARVLARAGANVLVAGLRKTSAAKPRKNSAVSASTPRVSPATSPIDPSATKWFAVRRNAGGDSTSFAPTPEFSRRQSSKT